MTLEQNHPDINNGLRLFYKLIPAKLLDSHNTRMESVVLLLTLISNIVITGFFVTILYFSLDNSSPDVMINGSKLVMLTLSTYICSFILLNRFAALNTAGNVAMVGIFLSGAVSGWYTGGIYSPMLYLLLVPPVYAFVLTNVASGVVWTLVTMLAYTLIWAVDDFGIAEPQYVISHSVDFSFLEVMAPTTTCMLIVAAIAIYEINSIQLKKLLAQERNMFAFKASHDPLTGLANRDEFNARIKLALETARSSNYPIALIYIDLDGFKPINDTLGHHAGDVVLETVSRRLERIVRGTDTVARLGGDEFAIILQGVGEDQQIKPILEKVLATISQDIPLEDGKIVNVRGSLGVAYFPQNADSAETLCRHADMAMYLAKEVKNTWRFYHEVDRSS